MRDFLFHRENRIGADSRILLARQRQHFAEIFLIRLSDTFKLITFNEVHIAVRQASAGLKNLEDIDVGILVILPDIAAEQCANAVACRNWQQFFERRLGLHAAHLFEPWLNRLQALFLNRCGIKIGAINIARLAAFAVFFGVEHQLYALFRKVIERSEHAVIGFIGRNCGFLCPFAAGIKIEIVTGRDRFVHAIGIETKCAKLRTVLDRCFDGWRGLSKCRCGQREQRGRSRQRDCGGEFHVRLPIN